MYEKWTRRDSVALGLLLALTPAFVFTSLGPGLFRWALKGLLIYFLAPTAIVGFLLGKTPRDFGVRLGNPRVFALSLLILPAAALMAYLASRDPSFSSYYREMFLSSRLDLLTYELVIGVGMFFCEAIYRGFYLFHMRKLMGVWSVAVQSIPYALAHAGKPTLELPYAYLAGVLFGYIDLKANSILPSFVIHWLGSMFMDLFLLSSP